MPSERQHIKKRTPLTREDFFFTLERISGHLMSEAGGCKMRGEQVESRVLRSIADALFETVEELESEIEKDGDLG